MCIHFHESPRVLKTISERAKTIEAKRRARMCSRDEPNLTVTNNKHKSTRSFIVIINFRGIDRRAFFVVDVVVDFLLSY